MRAYTCEVEYRIEGVRPTTEIVFEESARLAVIRYLNTTLSYANRMNLPKHYERLAKVNATGYGESAVAVRTEGGWQWA